MQAKHGNFKSIAVPTFTSQTATTDHLSQRKLTVSSPHGLTNKQYFTIVVGQVGVRKVQPATTTSCSRLLCRQHRVGSLVWSYSMLIRWPLHLCSCHWDGVSISFVPIATVAARTLRWSCLAFPPASPQCRKAAEREYVQETQTTGARNTRLYKHPTVYR